MITDKYGQVIVNEQDLCYAYLENPLLEIKQCYVEHEIKFDPFLELDNIPKLNKYDFNNLLETVSEYDARLQSNWNMPEEYKNLDIAVWLLEKCSTDEQRQRVGQELLMYLDRNMFPLLQYLLYLVNTMRSNNIVWGVGRGSSVASYVLYLIGVHKIDSIFYDLDITEFLR
jgi:DNA polymerase III alpha subunit